MTDVRTREVSQRTRAWLLACAVVVLAHLLLVIGIGSSIPDPLHRLGDSHQHVAGAGSSDRAPGQSSSYLTPEVRSLGGLSEHEWVATSPSMPGLIVPAQLVQDPPAMIIGSLAAPDAPGPAGRAPPFA